MSQEQVDLTNLEKQIMLKRQFRIQAENLGRVLFNLISERDGHVIEFDRSSGDCVCTECGLDYYSHPRIGAVALTVICTGDLVKL